MEGVHVTVAAEALGVKPKLCRFRPSHSYYGGKNRTALSGHQGRKLPNWMVVLGAIIIILIIYTSIH
jgi:hypothetical protein